MVYEIDDARYSEIVSRYPQLLQDKLSHCGELIRERNRHRCKSPACGCCRKLRGRSEGRNAVKFFGHSTNEDMALLTVAYSLAITIEEIEECTNKFKSDVRNLINRERRRSKRWGGVSIYGWFEADPINGCDIQIAPQRIKDYLSANRLVLSDKSVWNCHIHAIIDCSSVDWQEIRDVFLEKWRLPSQVDIRLLDSNKSKDDNLKSIAAYSHKFCDGKWWDGIFNQWSINDIVQYYSHKAKVNWYGNTFKINSKHVKTNNKQVNSNKSINDYGMEMLI